MKNRYDFLIVGCGFFGSIFARKVTDAGKTCLVIDKNPHIAGAAYDKLIENIHVSQYGAHIFHTHCDKIFNYLSQFTNFIPFINKPKVLTRNKVYSFPINMMTMHQLWGVVTPQEAYEKIESVKINIQNPKNFEEWALSKIGRELYETFIYGYTKKQYMKEPRNLPASIIQRLPIRLTYEENYFTTQYQGIPNNGYTNMVENILSGIQVELETDFFKLKNWKDFAKNLIYTGPIDKFFNYEFGKLEYNTLKFEHKIYEGNYQGNAVFNHVDTSTPYLRSVEHKHFYRNNIKHDLNLDTEKTIVSFDYPAPFESNSEPYYPIRDDKNSDLYNKYHNLNKNYSNIIFGGRIGEYKYLDIDQSVASAIHKAEKILC